MSIRTYSDTEILFHRKKRYSVSSFTCGKIESDAIHSLTGKLSDSYHEMKSATLRISVNPLLVDSHRVTKRECHHGLKNEEGRKKDRGKVLHLTDLPRSSLFRSYIEK